MCGLFGVMARHGAFLQRDDIKELVSMGKLAQRRGVDASGLVLLKDNQSIEIVKANHGFGTMVRTREAKTLLKSAGSGQATGIFGHSRLETHGYSGSAINNQPVVIGNWVVLHNGVITNAKELRSSIDIGDGGIETDTVAIALLLQEWDEGGRTESSDEVFKKLQGEYSIIAASLSGEVFCRTNVGNLYTAVGGAGQILIASEPRQFPQEFRHTCEKVKLNTTVIFGDSNNGQGAISVVDASRKEVGMEGAEGLHLQLSQLDAGFIKSMERVAEQAQERAASLERCTSCILPVTFPGIDFDDDGVCSVCRSFVMPEYLGLDQFVADLEKVLPPSREVLVCLSGGRDSSYILHLVNELGFKALAYTYDWGMVTTAARENMSKMCGDLGVEHIVVSPNIRQNRVRINRALKAWLKNPKLETIPILMAGDKPYFRWAREIGKERGNIPALLVDHQMETTGFKAVLAGVKFSPDDSQGASYRLDLAGMARMVFAYGTHGLQSPGMLPSLLKEGLTGFVDYYLREHNFVRPFSYIPWEEEKIDSTLRSIYGWSSGEDRSVTSWRMGDGTAPFYNLMYLLGLGLTEHDTLRSNQIRFGLMERSVALRQAAEDNSFNVLGLASYFATVGVDLEWAADRVGSFAKSCQ